MEGICCPHSGRASAEGRSSGSRQAATLASSWAHKAWLPIGTFWYRFPSCILFGCHCYNFSYGSPLSHIGPVGGIEAVHLVVSPHGAPVPTWTWRSHAAHGVCYVMARKPFMHQIRGRPLVAAVCFWWLLAVKITASSFEECMQPMTLHYGFPLFTNAFAVSSLPLQGLAKPHCGPAELKIR